MNTYNLRTRQDVRLPHKILISIFLSHVEIYLASIQDANILQNRNLIILKISQCFEKKEGIEWKIAYLGSEQKIFIRHFLT